MESYFQADAALFGFGWAWVPGPGQNGPGWSAGSSGHVVALVFRPPEVVVSKRVPSTILAVDSPPPGYSPLWFSPLPLWIIPPLILGSSWVRIAAGGVLFLPLGFYPPSSGNAPKHSGISSFCIALGLNPGRWRVTTKI